MKKFFVVFIVTIIAQCVSGQIICGYFPDTSSHGIRAPQNVTYGDVFTPKGQIRVLIVFVSYGMPYDMQYLDGWIEQGRPSRQLPSRDTHQQSNDQGNYHLHYDEPIRSNSMGRHKS